MTSIRCSRQWEADAVREGRLSPKDVESFERHCATCTACAEGVARDERLRALGRELTDAEPGQLVVKRLRARILRDVVTAGAPRRRLSARWRWTLVSLVGVSFVVVAGLVGISQTSRGPLDAEGPSMASPTDSPSPLAGLVTPTPGAAWKQTREDRIEKVVLDRGTLRVHVRPQQPGERFLVQLPDGELEVRGTTFEVTVLDGSTRGVGVDEGTVVLRLRGSPDQSLGAGTRWSVSDVPSSEPREAVAPGPTGVASNTPRAATPRHRQGTDREEAGDPDDGASAYVAAMESFRDGQYDRAASAFHAFTLAYPLATEAEDASFLEALSLAKEGRVDAAALAAERHLERFPRSFRREEASILVARGAVHRGRCDEALGVLAPWKSTSSDAELKSVLVACSGAAP